MIEWNFNPQSAVLSIRVESLEDMRRLAVEMARSASIPRVVALQGTLGAGKTQWTRFFAESLGADGNSISSPTFVLIHQYGSTPPIHHMDAYRIGDEDELLELGFEELIDGEAITIVEWADRFASVMPKETLWVRFDLVPGEEQSRTIRVESTGKAGKAWIGNLAKSLSSGSGEGVRCMPDCRGF